MRPSVEWLLAELEAARKALDCYGMHEGGCPAVRRWAEPCDCGLDAAQTRLRDAVRKGRGEEI